MKIKRSLVCLLLAGLTGCVESSLAQEPQRWEYKVVPNTGLFPAPNKDVVSASFELMLKHPRNPEAASVIDDYYARASREFNELGADRWELVGFEQSQAIFKRPR